MKPVLIVGAGFSGLTLGYWLNKKGIPCAFIEKESRAGGLIHTKILKEGLVETAANGFLPNAEILEICRDLNLPLAHRKSERKKRYIFRKIPRRWPLNFKETLKLMFKFLKHGLMGFQSLKPRKNESVQQWALRNFDHSTLNWLIAPALQGIYAGRVDHLSSYLIFNREKKTKSVKGLRGTVAPEKGMGQLIEALVQHLKSRGAEFKFNQEGTDFVSADFSAIVIAASGWQLRDFKIDGKNIAENFEVESLPLISANIFFENHQSDLKGFGCLFPKSQGFYSLGVLFNSSVFENRSSLRSETWIFGGALNKDISRFSDDEILRQITADRVRLHPHSEKDEPVKLEVTRWPQALPHMTLKLEAQLNQLQLPRNVYLSGNYLGSVGLSQIAQRNHHLAEEISNKLKGGFLV